MLRQLDDTEKAMSIALTLDELLPIIGGRTIAQAQQKLTFRGVEFDSREIKGGELFIALKGAAAHGHTFLKSAFDRGAALLLIEDERAAADFPEPQRLILVEDTLKAFWQLATWWREKLNLPVLAITGSVGKTTTKELAAAILLESSQGNYSLKSHNNHTGVPYTILRTSPDHQWLVLEMGMNHAGELRELSKMARPDVVCITCIAPAHIEFFGTLEAIADAKLEILDGLRAGGRVVLPADDQTLQSRAAKRDLSKFAVTTFAGSAVAGADVWVDKVRADGIDAVHFDLHLGGSAASVTLHAPGVHNARNCSAAALAVTALISGFPLNLVASGIERFRAPLMRLAVVELTGGRRLVDDSYNANPASMSAFLALARELQAGGSRIGLILGDMLELGAAGERYHREIGDQIYELKPSFCLAVGALAPLYLERAAGAGIPCVHVESPELAAHTALKLDFDLLLVKGSRGIQLERCVAVLKKRAAFEP